MLIKIHNHVLQVQLGLNRLQTNKNKVQRKTIYYDCNEKIFF